jgi:ketosteroid isomerase-like protein
VKGFTIRGSLAVSLLVMGTLSPVSPLPAQTPVSDSAAIHDLARQFSSAYVRGDAGAMTELYTSDAVIFPERSEAIRGHEAIRRYWTLPAGRRITHHVITPAHITVDGRHTYDHGTFEVAGARDGKSWGPSQGKYVVVWRREGTSWRIHLDMWNSGPQPPS